MSPSLVYRSALSYGTVMHALYGRYYSARFATLAALVPEGASVLDVCCGPGTLYLGHLRDRGVRYTGLDLSETFVARLRRRGVAAEVRDVADGAPLPEADVVIMQASLYQFLPDAREIVDRMRTAAGDAVIVAEPIRNLSTSRLAPLAALAQRGASTESASHEQRFDEASLDAFMRAYGDAVRQSLVIPGGREKVYVLRGAQA